MPHLLIRHKAQDYARWKPLFDEHGATRRANGSKGGRLYRNAGDPNEIVINSTRSGLDFGSGK